LNSLSGRFLLLTIGFVMLAEVLIFVPSIARFRAEYLLQRLEKAQIASLAQIAAEDMVTPELEAELLANAQVFNIVLRRNESRQLILSSPIPGSIAADYDLRMAGPFSLIMDAGKVLLDSDNHVIRVIGSPTLDAGILIEITLESAPLRAAMLDYGLRVLLLSALISVVTAALLFIAVRRLLVLPIRRVVQHMAAYAEAPQDARRVIVPNAGVTELRQAEEALQSLQTQLIGALRQKERLAALGGAVAKVSHDLRNILTSAQLFADRLEGSADPVLARFVPKLMGSITRAVHLTEATLAFGKAEEPPPRLTRFSFRDLSDEVIEAEGLSAEGMGEQKAIIALVDIAPTLFGRADQEQMFRVLSNLVRNARQALEAQGTGGTIEISAGESDTDWWIRVGDSGPGLPVKAREHLFAAFQGGARRGGTGLGLAIAAELVGGHGGRLDLARSDSEGTEFVIHLPKGGEMGDAG
jgi:signal transduction histidine kinase